MRTRLTPRSTWPWLAGVDGALIGLVGLAALDFLLIAIADTAGPFGAMVLPALAFLGLAAPLLLVRLVATVRRRAPGRSGVWLLLVVLLGLPMAVGAIPLRDRFDRWSDRRAERRVGGIVEKRAVACAVSAARRYPDEPETNPGVFIRPLLTSAVARCMERPVENWSVTCGSGSGCEVRPPNDRNSRTLVVRLDGYMDTALRAAGYGPWNRWPQPGYSVPPKPWVTPAG